MKSKHFKDGHVGIERGHLPEWTSFFARFQKHATIIEQQQCILYVSECLYVYSTQDSAVYVYAGSSVCECE